MLEISDESIESVVRMVLDATFGMPFETRRDASEDTPGTTTAFVGIVGQWNGAVIITCESPLARGFAAVMFGVAPDDIERDQLDDVLGELANIIGGNIKGLLPSPCLLSLPTVVDGSDFRFRMPGAQVVRTLAFRHGEDTLRVLLAEQGSTL